MRTPNRENAYLNFYSTKVPRLTMPFGEAACRFAASALKLTNYTYITPPPLFTSPTVRPPPYQKEKIIQQ
jgi:hypothetical protein